MSPPFDVSDHDPGDLFARARAGDQDAWKELFETCYPKVLRVVRRKLDRPMRSLYDSTDFASDVMKSLAAKFDKFDFPSLDSLHAYLVQAAKQKVIDEYRRRHTLKHDIGRERSVDWVDGARLDAARARLGGPHRQPGGPGQRGPRTTPGPPGRDRA